MLLGALCQHAPLSARPADMRLPKASASLWQTLRDLEGRVRSMASLPVRLAAAAAHRGVISRCGLWLFSLLM